ncbi:MAG: hypothetical protein DIZ77_08520 [endosymbiont of Seepiophila jonesi]|uniref:Uncharacterized protein n=1 Tax=endosymbiont of Lamellibrachia luymesi TaxID=2200907 RepID=A0A370E1B5_9GAMM|nr:MAG: hypothetical protein DIZ77_08520 [endosymbiont of Seepiophila jonesi]RDH92614.1 MAG: hypothetical protein DIZ79_02955 [endosymbiont of Lamellibrachia luymesi]
MFLTFCNVSTNKPAHPAPVFQDESVRKQQMQGVSGGTKITRTSEDISPQTEMQTRTLEQ